MVFNVLKAASLAFALALTGLAIPVQEANAHRVCRTYWSHGVKHRTCSTAHRHYPRTVCRTYWRHGVKYRHCYRRY